MEYTISLGLAYSGKKCLIAAALQLIDHMRDYFSGAFRKRSHTEFHHLRTIAPFMLGFVIMILMPLPLSLYRPLVSFIGLQT